MLQTFLLPRFSSMLKGQGLVSPLKRGNRNQTRVIQVQPAPDSDHGGGKAKLLDQWRKANEAIQPKAAAPSEAQFFDYQRHGDANEAMRIPEIERRKVETTSPATTPLAAAAKLLRWHQHPAAPRAPPSAQGGSIGGAGVGGSAAGEAPCSPAVAAVAQSSSVGSPLPSAGAAAAPMPPVPPSPIRTSWLKQAGIALLSPSSLLSPKKRRAQQQRKAAAAASHEANHHHHHHHHHRHYNKPHATRKRELGDCVLAAARRGAVDAVLVALRDGAHVEARDSLAMTPLLHAARRGHVRCCEALLDNGAHLNAHAADGVTATILAASEGHGELLRLLLKRGAHVNHVTNRGHTALLLSVIRRRQEAFHTLLEHPATGVNEADAGGLTPLHYAVQNGDLKAVMSLVSHGADLSCMDAFGKRAVDHARSLASGIRVAPAKKPWVCPGCGIANPPIYDPLTMSSVPAPQCGRCGRPRPENKEKALSPEEADRHSAFVAATCFAAAAAAAAATVANLVPPPLFLCPLPAISEFLSNLPANGKAVMQMGLTKMPWTTVDDMKWCALPLEATLPCPDEASTAELFERFDKSDDPLYRISYESNRDRIARHKAKKAAAAAKMVARHGQRMETAQLWKGRKVERKLNPPSHKL